MVCKLTMNCSCMPSTSVSFADKEILHCLVKGLVDEDICKKVLGVVEEMDLENTVKYVEAKESGKKAGDYLDSGEADVNKVTGYKQVQKDQAYICLIHFYKRWWKHCLLLLISEKKLVKIAQDEGCCSGAGVPAPQEGVHRGPPRPQHKAKGRSFPKRETKAAKELKRFP